MGEEPRSARILGQLLRQGPRQAGASEAVEVIAGRAMGNAHALGDLADALLALVRERENFENFRVDNLTAGIRFDSTEGSAGKLAGWSLSSLAQLRACPMLVALVMVPAGVFVVERVRVGS